MHSAFYKDQNVDFKLGGRGSMHSNRVLQGLRAHRKEAYDLRELARPGYTRKENLGLKGVACPISGALRLYLDGAEAGKWTLHSSFQSSSHLESGFACAAEYSVMKRDGASAAALMSGTASDSGDLTQVQDGSCFKRMWKPTALVGGLHLGLCGNALIMRVGSDTRCFHHQASFVRPVDFEEHGCSSNTISTSDFKMPGWSRLKVAEHIPVKGRRGLAVPQGKPISTKSRVDRSAVLQNKRGKTSLPRDLYEKSPFHLLEAFLCFRHPDPNAVTSKFQFLSRKTMEELVNVMNQTAIGLTGVGATWVLFVGSKIIWFDAFLSRHSMLSLAIGCGFLWLSWAMKRVSEVLMCSVNHSGSKNFQKDYMISLKNELRHLTLTALVLVAMCLMGSGSLL